MKTVINTLKIAYAWSKDNPKKAIAIFVVIAAIGSTDDSQKSDVVTESVVDNPVSIPITSEAVEIMAKQEIELTSEYIPLSEPEYIINVPTLFGLNIDQVREKIADNETIAQLQTEEEKPSEYDNKDDVFTFGDYKLYVSFSKETRTVSSLFLSKINDALTEKELNNMLLNFALSKASNTYEVKLKEADKDSRKYVGVIIRTPEQIREAEKKIAAAKKEQEAIILRELQIQIDEMLATGGIMALHPESGEVHVNPRSWASLTFPQKQNLARMLDQYLEALPESQMGLWGIYDGITGERIGKLDWRNEYKTVD